MLVLKQIGWWVYAVLMTILTLGVFVRFHLVTKQLRELGGVRAGMFGCTLVIYGYLDREHFLAIRRWWGQDQIPLKQVASVGTMPIATITIETTGGKAPRIMAWSLAEVENYIRSGISAGT